ncbi:hypothetical protein [Pedobacter polysacchareus]|uniref:hypothetical protein n=1 Tax=Pedobacter polysacchareus TaxID=2861973 RepID=UPI001C99EC8D|nr:hypothetical protein [Pedobacter polysacchareus]
MLKLTLKGYKTRKSILLHGTFLLFIGLLSSCGRPLNYYRTYNPEVKLEKSLSTINKTITINNFTDNRSIKDKLDPNGYVNPPRYIKDLPVEITNAIINDFSKNLVFKKIGMQMDTSDYIMEGEIKNFRKNFKSSFFKSKEQIYIDLECKIYTRDGKLVSTYSGKSIIENKVPSLFGINKFLMNQHVRINDAFSNSVLQIRDQILKDSSKFVYN